MKPNRIGRYDLVRKIAAGGMAEVFLVRESTNLTRDVVIKRMFRHHAEDPKLLEMFQLEAKVMAELSHPGIPQIYELGSDDDGNWFIAMEWIDGHNVADLWRNGARLNRPMPMPVSVAIATQVAEALHHAHERADRGGTSLRIVHRDVTPQNIMVTRDGVAKLIDFGVCQSAAHPFDAERTPKGTYSYMAPEQVRGESLDRRADVFALGVLLYELTTGTRLFRGTEVEVMTAIVEREVERPSLRAERYPLELEQVVLGALAKDVAARPPTAAHFARDLERFAMHAGWPMGVRSVASYVQAVFPHVREPEPEAALIAPISTTAELPTLADESAPEHMETPDPLASTGDPSSQVDWPTPAVFDFALVVRDDQDAEEYLRKLRQRLKKR